MRLRLRAQSRRPAAVHPVLWREITIEPGLKVLVEEGWTKKSDVIAKLQAALEQLGEKR